MLGHYTTPPRPEDSTTKRLPRQNLAPFTLLSAKAFERIQQAHKQALTDGQITHQPRPLADPRIDQGSAMVGKGLGQHRDVGHRRQAILAQAHRFQVTIADGQRLKGVAFVALILLH